MSVAVEVLIRVYLCSIVPRACFRMCVSWRIPCIFQQCGPPRNLHAPTRRMIKPVCWVPGSALPICLRTSGLLAMTLDIRLGNCSAYYHLVAHATGLQSFKAKTQSNLVCFDILVDTLRDAGRTRVSWRRLSHNTESPVGPHQRLGSCTMSRSPIALNDSQPIKQSTHNLRIHASSSRPRTKSQSLCRLSRVSKST